MLPYLGVIWTAVPVQVNKDPLPQLPNDLPLSEAQFENLHRQGIRGLASRGSRGHTISRCLWSGGINPDSLINGEVGWSCVEENQ